MRNKFLFFLVCTILLLQTVAFAQMQGVISNSSERVSRSIVPVAQTVRVEKYRDDMIITLWFDKYSGNYNNSNCGVSGYVGYSAGLHIP